MVRVEKLVKPKTAKKTVQLDANVSVELEYDGREVRIVKDGRVFGYVGGDFVEACVFVEEYKLCFTKKEIEGELSVS
jgi:hypothetical protein